MILISLSDFFLPPSRTFIQSKKDLHQTPSKSKVKVAKVPCLYGFLPFFFHFLASSTTVSMCGVTLFCINIRGQFCEISIFITVKV